MILDSDKNVSIIEKAGFYCLLLTVFIISFPRSWSLYSLALFLIIGASLWILNFKKILLSFLKEWGLILPAVLYFFLNLISSIMQENSFGILQTRLMFFFVPIFGFPIFISEYSKPRILQFFKAFILGMLLISIYLIINVIFKLYNNYPGAQSLTTTYPVNFPFFPWLKDRQLDYSSMGYSIMEHPTYLAFKINWALLLIAFINWENKFNRKYMFAISVILTFSLFLLGSKAGLLLWFILIIVFLTRKIKRSQNKVFYIILIPVFMFLTFFSITKIGRVERSIKTFITEITKSKNDWKNIGPRSREWYSALQIINEKPLFGAGISKVNDEMVRLYVENGFKEEAAYRYNAHNQFLEAQMTFGIAGTMCLLFLLFGPFIFRKKFFQFFLIKLFIGINIFFFSIESVLNRQWGIMFFLLFYFILILPYSSPEVRKL
jgi:O-antigen ligase